MALDSNIYYRRQKATPNISFKANGSAAAQLRC